MKKIITFHLLVLAASAFSQAPEFFKYQSVARNNLGDILVNQSFGFHISILQGGTSGTIVYSEIHETVTNNFGLVNLEIGNGNPVTGDFASINWGAGDFFLKIEMDEAGGTNYQLMGTSQLLSVPYALYAKNSGASDDGDWTVSGDNIYTMPNGNIGIGTDNPVTDFELSDAGSYLYENAELRVSLFSDGSNAMPRISFVRSHSPTLGDYSSANAVTQNGNVLGRFTFGGIRVNGTGGSSSGAGWFEMIQKGSTSESGVPGQFQIITADGLGNRDTRFVVSPEGNVGIGTETPSEKLDVEGDINMNGNQIKNMVIENRTSDPANPAVGQIWLRTDL